MRVREKNYTKNHCILWEDNTNIHEKMDIVEIFRQ